MAGTVIVRELGLQPYQPILDAMHEFTDQRDASTADEIWILQHQPVFTQGQAGKAEHVLVPGDIPVVKADRGGQVTYHGPGQLIVYLLWDLKRLGMGVRDLVSLLEDSVVHLLSLHDVEAYAKSDAPGVYVAEAKLASLGLRVRRGCSFHGLALNMQMDMEPFQRINPCGYPGLQMVQLAELLPSVDPQQIQQQLLAFFIERAGFTEIIHRNQLDKVLHV